MPWKKGQSGNPKGKPKGTKHKSTLDKEAAKAYLRERVVAELGPLLDSQLANAKGIKYLVVRERKGGKFVRVSEAMAKLAKGGKLGDSEEIIEVWEKDPSVHAFQDLLDRALDKAAQPIKGEEGSPIQIVCSWEK